MGNNTKSEQDKLCISIINPRLCKKVSIEVAIEQHDTETTIPYLHVFLDNMWAVSYTHLDVYKRQVMEL